MKRILSFAAALVIVASAALAPIGSVAAQSSAALSITPRKNYTVEAGKTIRDTLTIRNMDSVRTLNLNLGIVDFSFKDDGGTPDLMTAEDAPQTAWSLKPFVKLATTKVDIKPRESKTVDVTITIPKGQGAGSYYSAITYASGDPATGNVGLSATGVTLAFVTVPGNVKQDLKLERFGAYQTLEDGKKEKFIRFAMNKPRNIAYQLKNSGNVAESPVGTVVLKHMFGQEIRINDINVHKSLALRGQTRTFISCITTKDQNLEDKGVERSNAKVCDNPPLWPGLYTASLDAFYGQNGNNTKEISGSSWFIYAPLWFIIAFAIALAAVAFGIWQITRRVKSGRRGGMRTKRSNLRR